MRLEEDTAVPCDNQTIRGINIRDWRINGVPLKDQAVKFESPEIEAHYQRTFNISASAAAQLFADVKKFVYVAGVGGFEVYAPPPRIDRGWHEFILHTSEYATFCKMIGRFVHHAPRPDPHPGDADAMEQARTKAEKVFGPLSSNWDSSEKKW